MNYSQRHGVFVSLIYSLSHSEGKLSHSASVVPQDKLGTYLRCGIVLLGLSGLCLALCHSFYGFIRLWLF